MTKFWKAMSESLYNQQWIPLYLFLCILFVANIFTKNVSFDLFFMAHLILMWSSAASIWILNDDWLRHDIIHRSVVDESEKNRNKKCHCSVFQYCSYLEKDGKNYWKRKKIFFFYVWLTVAPINPMSLAGVTWTRPGSAIPAI